MSQHSKFAFGLSFLICSFVFLVLAAPCYGQTFTTVSNGNWNSPATWAGGLVPNTDPVAPGVTINVNHTVFYDRGTPIRNQGTFRIERVLPAVPARLNLPSGINIENLSGAIFDVTLATLSQCRFASCNNGQPYSGVNPSAPIQTGSIRNIGGYFEVESAIVEVAQDFINESNGFRVVEEACILAGRNYLSSNSDEQLEGAQLSIGWHGTGSFQIMNSRMRFNRSQIQLAGATGDFSLDSNTRTGGNIDYITLRNPIGNFVGAGEIFFDPNLKDLNGFNGINLIDLDAYCVSDPSKYKPNGKVFGTQAPICDNRSGCLSTAPTAGEAALEGRVTTHDGRGLGGIRVTVTGNDLAAPITAITSPFGYYRIAGLEAGNIYFATVQSKRYRFVDPVRAVSIVDSFTQVDFVAEAPAPIKAARGR